MASLGMTQKEYDYWVDNYAEAAKLIGEEAKLLQVESEYKDLYYDPDRTYKDSRDIGVLFEENPKPILKKMNWFQEDESLPYLAYVVAKDNELEPLEIKEGMIILLRSKYGLITDRRFLVTDVRGTSINPLGYLCKLVPDRERVDFDETTPEIEHSYRKPNDVNYGYLNIDKK